MKFKIYTHIILFLALLCCMQSASANVSLLQLKKETQTTDSLAIQKEQTLLDLMVKKQQKVQTQYYVMFGIMLLLILLFAFLCFRNNKNKQLKEIRKLLEENSHDTSRNDHQKLCIDTTTVTSILEHLESFENEQGFLTSKISLHEVAKKLQTNTKYLSRVINNHKLKSFRNYINDLRIEYTLDRLKKEAKYKKYTVKAIAKEVGFSTAESFSKAFRKKTGTTVSKFLEK